MIGKQWLVLVAIASLALGACSSTGAKVSTQGGGAPQQTTEPYTDQVAPAPTTNDGSEAGYDAAMAAERSLTTNVIYFDFDESVIKADYQSVVDAYSRYLTANPSAKVRLEGHTDERGTREYNIGLGERRANAVYSAMLAQGVSPQQMSVISYGEERPADPGHNEAAWAKNRRVQIVRQ